VQPVPNPEFDRLSTHLAEVEHLLSRHRLVENLVSRQEMPNHRLVDSVVQKQNLTELGALLARIDAPVVARVLESLSREDRLRAWHQIKAERTDAILLLLLDEVREELIASTSHDRGSASVSAFELHDGRLRQVDLIGRDDLEGLKPVWIDLVAPSTEVRFWFGQRMGVDLPAPDSNTDLETSTRFYVEDNGAVYLHSNFLINPGDGPRTVPVLFVFHRDVLFSLRPRELSVFRLQRLRACTQPDYVSDAWDILLDLYAADIEFSAEALEDIYARLKTVGDAVLHPEVSDSIAARVLVDIAHAEDLNGRIRHSVLDTRRAVSFLMRGKVLSAAQHEQAREIIRDIESLDGHTTFLFGKINFLMDATVGFININQNKRVSKLTSIGIIFMPINIIAGIGGMSEFSMITTDLGIEWPWAYGAFVAGAVLAGWATHVLLRLYESREMRRARGASSAAAR